MLVDSPASTVSSIIATSWESFQLGYHLQTNLLFLSRICNLFIYQNLNLVVLDAYLFFAPET